MTEAEKTNEIQALLDSLADNKVTAQHMILLLQAIDNKPELVQKALIFLS